MPQDVLPFQYEIDKKPGGMIALAGLPLYLDLAHVIGASAFDKPACASTTGRSELD